ncbi:MAG: M48 family metalloprotease [Armatimonadota bacterium]
MALRVSSAKRKKRLVLRDRDFRFPGERALYLQAVLGVIVFCAVLAGISYWMAALAQKRTAETQRAQISTKEFEELTPEQQEKIKAQLQNPRLVWQVPAALAAWPFATLLVVPILACAPMRRRLKKMGPRAKVMGNNYPEIWQLVRSQCQLIGVREPEAYVIDDDVAMVSTLSGRRPALLITKPAQEALTGEELAAAIAHELGHIKCGHVRMMNVIDYLLSAKRIWRVIWWPAGLLAFVLKGWAEVIEWSADRASLLLVGKIAAVNAFMVKLALESDVMGQVDSTELREYLAGGGELSSDGEQVERHYRIGTFISDQPGLTERIRMLGEFPKTDEGRAAFEKLAEIRAA